MVGGGRPLLPEILCQTDRVGAKSPIFLLHSFASTECRGLMALTSTYTESIHIASSDALKV